MTSKTGAVSVPLPTASVTVAGALDVTEYVKPVQLTKVQVPMAMFDVPEPIV